MSFDYSDTLKILEKEEGFRGRLYKDHLGYNTIGYGFCLDKIDMPIVVAEYWLKLIVMELHEKLSKKTVYTWLSNKRQSVLLSMAYQLGVDGLFKFEKMWKALENGDYKTAAAEMLDSRWATQTKDRAMRMSKIMLTNE